MFSSLGHFPARSLTDSIVYILEVGKDGFNAYQLAADGSCELIAASSSMSTFLKVMERIASSANGAVQFAVVGASPAKRPEYEI